ncbi:MAG TPA: cupin domain-containing protein [Gammaproteobacteria bacterium]|nr:cupin domain-containing protein [Gammaproteobacteria bacterium]
MSNETQPLFVLEMANNHMGDVNHGIKLIEAFADVCQQFPFRFGFKMQYRDLDTYLHPDALGSDLHYVKRFNDTRLPPENRRKLVEAIKQNGFLPICTPFDNASVAQIVEDGFSVIKIASCSFGDWPLMEEIAATNLPIIASCAGASTDDIDAVVSFLGHRDKEFTIMHCVAEYPMAPEIAQLNQIDYLQQRYPGLSVGFSTHEPPEDANLVRMAIAKGCRLFEKHVALPTDEYSANAYSATPQQVQSWLANAQEAFAFCGVSGQRADPTDAEKESLFSLRRGIFLNKDLAEGSEVSAEDVYMAFPTQPGQITANDWSKYRNYTLTTDASKDGPLDNQNSTSKDVRSEVWKIVQAVKEALVDGNIVVPGKADLEISHHYGIENFYETGITMITVVNRDYCKKLIVVLPGQNHPEQYHNRKEETFMVLEGNLSLVLDGAQQICEVGDVVTVKPGVRHAFSSVDGAVIEELSSTHYADDSFYTDESINTLKNRKTLLTYWM